MASQENAETLARTLLGTNDPHLSAGVNFVSAMSGQGTFTEAGGVVTFVLDNVAAGAAVTATVVAQAPPAPGLVSATASVQANEADKDKALAALEVGDNLNFPRQFPYTDANGHRKTGTQIITAPFGLA